MTVEIRHASVLDCEKAVNAFEIKQMEGRIASDRDWFTQILSMIHTCPTGSPAWKEAWKRRVTEASKVGEADLIKHARATTGLSLSQLPPVPKRRQARLSAEPIPETATRLPEPWEKCMEYALIRHDACQICGWHTSLSARPRWDFDDATRIQTLVDLEVLCMPCHAVRDANGSDWCWRHLAEVNSWSNSHARIYLNAVSELCRLRSQHAWATDLTYLGLVGVRHG